LVAAGLEQVLDYLESLSFSAEDLEWLSRRFPPMMVDSLAAIRFTGDVDAMSEGTPFFADEPILRVSAPLPLAQFVETRVINLLHLQTLIASKAARVVLAAPGKLLVDFGLRRAHGAEAGLLAARAAYLAGFAGSATVLANVMFGVPVFGTMAHSFVQSFGDEMRAFEAFARSHPDNTILLIDTYDTEAAARKVVKLASKLRADGITVKGVRIDSGDLASEARRVRAILDEGGFADIAVFVSGSLDEYRVQALVDSGAPVSGFGVGTALTTSDDAPALDCVYKLQEYAGVARRKTSHGKATWPGRKQVFRFSDGVMLRDVVALEGENAGEAGRALLEPVMRAGKRVGPAPALDELRSRALAAYDELPPALRGLDGAQPYTIEISEEVRALAQRLDEARRP
ncbi:MAG TPA: nicotinate phosphoribosyltransferase, partial [Burkholderiales bacterium]|nr:nicotinate phosphoribosyltransferase [Burkholderiales bacterium]